MKQNVSIKYVAAYLRKSRGENDSDLDNHRLILKELCEKNQWTAVEYAEIETGDSITLRPQMQRLLLDVTNEVYDAVCVVDIDRLGRGDLGDQDKIKKAFAKSGTFIVTPQHIYDLENENDDFAVDIKSFLARQEYKQIVKRLAQGKKVGARRGHWTNGTPPFPYEYERWGDSHNPKGLVVNRDKLDAYRFMVDCTANKNIPPKAVSIELNKRGIPSPRGGKWSGMIVYRLMLNETHLGWIVSNKTSGDAHATKKENAKDFKKHPREEWSIVKDCHEAVKTQEEHTKIKIFYSRLDHTARRKPTKTIMFSGLIKCGLCGRTMGTHIRYNKTEHVKPCYYESPEGVKCRNSGGVITMDIVLIIKDYFENQKARLNKSLEKGIETEIQFGIEKDISSLKSTVEARKKTLDRITDAYEEGAYSLTQYRSRKEKIVSQISTLNEEVEVLESRLKAFSAEHKIQVINDIDRVLFALTDPSVDPAYKNTLLKQVLAKIVWTRQGDNLDLQFEMK